MSELLGHSIYLTDYRRTGRLPAVIEAAGGSPVFLSLHISEEFDENYTKDMTKLCAELNAHHCKILADVSKETAKQFDVPDILSLKEKLGIWAFRLDYGFTTDEILALAAEMPVVLNASTTSDEEALAIASRGREVYAMHNFYPRPDTGLDRAYCKERTDMLKQAGLKVIGFIPGTKVRRGPIFEGLPTLECHRRKSSYTDYLDLVQNFHMDVVFAADPEISDRDEEMIRRYAEEDIITVPCHLKAEYAWIYDHVFHNRIDSPSWLIRLQESRTYSQKGKQDILPAHTEKRIRGSITIDNVRYKRYCSEVQIMACDLPADERVNIAGHVDPAYEDVVSFIPRGAKLILKDAEH